MREKTIMLRPQKIVFKNFRGRATKFTREGDRRFAAYISVDRAKDFEELGIRVRWPFGECECKLPFVWIKMPSRMYGDKLITDSEKAILDMLDHRTIVDSELVLYAYDVEINGRKYVNLYLKSGNFELTHGDIIEIRNDKIIMKENKNMAESKYMSREETIVMMALVKAAFHTLPTSQQNDEATKKLLKACESAQYYMTIDQSDSTNKPTVTGYKLEKTGDFASIKQVIFNDPATIVVWFDDVKTVVKCQEGDTFDKEKGLAMAICKRLYGNESNFNNLIKKWTEPNVKKAVKEAIKKVESNKTAKNKSKARKNVKNTSNVVITDAYINHVRVKMAKRGIKSYTALAKMCGVSQTTFSRNFGNAKRKSRVMYRSTFNKINKTLGIRWG